MIKNLGGFVEYVGVAPCDTGNTYQAYPFPAPTPRDAYREGLINRWELEQYEGPMPQALQGPSPDGSRVNGGGEGKEN